MKFQKKLFALIFFVSCLILNNPCLEATSGVRVDIFLTPRKQTKIRVYFSTKSYLEKESEDIVKRISKGSSAIGGGAYGEVPKVEDYEVHHLVSSSFCKRSRIIETCKAPAISIPKNLHRKTGSHGASGYSRVYLALEQFVFRRTHSIRMVWLLGIRDFKRVLKNNGGSPEKIQSEVVGSPCKKSCSAAICASARKNKECLSRCPSEPIPFVIENDDSDFLDSPYVISIHNSYNSMIGENPVTLLGKLTKSLLDAPHDSSCNPNFRHYEEAEQVLDVLIKQFFLENISNPNFKRKMPAIKVYEI